MKPALLLAALASLLGVTAVDGQVRPGTVETLDFRPSRPASPTLGRVWQLHECSTASCNFVIEVQAPQTARACAFDMPDVLMVHDQASANPPYAVTTSIHWTLRSLDAARVRFGWSGALPKPGIRVRDAVEADGDLNDTESSTSFGAFQPTTGVETEGTIGVVAAALKRRMYFYRVFVEYSRDNGANWTPCERVGPMIVNNG